MGASSQDHPAPGLRRRPRTGTTRPDGIVYIPGLAYDLEPLHHFEEGVIAKLGS